jgi:hypothetical protein
MPKKLTWRRVEPVAPGSIRFESAPTARVTALEAGVLRVLDAFGHPDAFVTDESRVSNFGLDEHEVRTASETLGVSIAEDELIVDVAARLPRR